MKGVMLGDGVSEAEIENNRDQLPHHLHEVYTALVTTPFWDQDHRLTGHLLCKDSVSECRL